MTHWLSATLRTVYFPNLYHTTHLLLVSSMTVYFQHLHHMTHWLWVNLKTVYIPPFISMAHRLWVNLRTVYFRERRYIFRKGLYTFCKGPFILRREVYFPTKAVYFQSRPYTFNPMSSRTSILKPLVHPHSRWIGRFFYRKFLFCRKFQKSFLVFLNHEKKPTITNDVLETFRLSDF